MTKKLLFASLVFIACFSIKAESQNVTPWLIQAYKELYNRAPTAWEKNYGNYNNSNWSSYEELKGYVKQYQASLQKAGLTISLSQLNNNTSVAFFSSNGRLMAADLIKTDVGKIIAAGGGNIIAAGGGNVISPNGSNIIAAGGGNLKSVTFGSQYQPLAVGTTVIPASGKGALIIR